MNRADFMARVRDATAHLTPVERPERFVQPHASEDWGSDELIDLFRARLEELAGEQELVTCADGAELTQAIRERLVGVDPAEILWAGEPCAAPRELRVGITGAVAAAAASASVIVDVGSPTAGFASLLCLHSIVVVPRDLLVPEVLSWYQSDGARNHSGYVVQITGASRTADIQKTLVSPAHGPARLSVIIGPAGCEVPDRGLVLLAAAGSSEDADPRP